MKKTTIKLVLVALAIILVVINAYLVYRYLYTYKEVYFATGVIKPFTAIEGSDVIKRRIPLWLYNDHMITDISQLSGHFADINTTIYPDMIFDERMVIDQDHRDNYSKYRLLDDEVIFSLATDNLKDLRGLLTNDQCVDVYLSIKQKKQAPLVDWLFKNVRIIGIKDKYGKQLTDIDEIPYLINLAIHRSYLPYLLKAQELGDLQLFVTNIDCDQTAFNVDSELLKYLS